METCCYQLRDAFGKKLQGGVVHASTMEAAARRAIQVSGVTPSMRDQGPILGPAYYFELDGKKVYLRLSVHPENILDDSEMNKL